MKKILFYLASPIVILHIVAFLLMRSKKKIKEDIRRYLNVKNHENYSVFIGLVYLLLKYPEFRSVFYMRVPKIWRLFCFYLPGRTNLYISTPSHRIGGGLYIGHGWGTVINAERIGKNCLVGQNVTIGSRNRKEAVLEDNVSVWAHAVVLGDITIGHDSQIGAGAVVVKTVPPCSVVVPAKSTIIRKDGNKCNISL